MLADPAVDLYGNVKFSKTVQHPTFTSFHKHAASILPLVVSTSMLPASYPYLFLQHAVRNLPLLVSTIQYAASILLLPLSTSTLPASYPFCFHKHAASILPLPVSTNTPPAFYSILFPKTLYQHPTSFLSEHAASILPPPVETAFYAYLCVIFKQFASTFLNQHSTFVETFIAHAAGIIPPYQHIYTLPAIYS